MAWSSDFPTVNPLKAELGDTVPIATGEVGDAFVSVLAVDASQLLYSTYLGGSGPDSGNAIAVNGAGRIFVTGHTNSPDFPVSADAIDPTCGMDGTCEMFPSDPHRDAFLVILDPFRSGGESLVYSTYLGGLA